jgi:hypothetical protein
MRLLVPDGTRRRGLPCDEATTVPPPASPAPGSGRTVVVGIRRDAASKELLTWVLVKVANAGDRVVALHVAALHVAAAADGAYPRLSHIPSADLFSPSISTKSEAIVLFGFCMFLRERRAMLETFSPSVPSSIALRKLILSFFSVSLSSFRIADGNR